MGYDALLEAQYIRSDWRLAWRLRAKEKGGKATYSTRAWFDWQRDGWMLRTNIDANYVQSYGVSVFQDIAYDLTPYTIHHPLSLRLRLQFFDARDWDNRIYCYEHDVLYAFSIPAIYGLGGRAYFCLRCQIIPQLTLYFRVSETLYAKNWAVTHNRPITHTDLHLLLRATL